MQYCAGILLYRKKDNVLEVFLVHPGGPFFAKNDKCWGIPKGLQEKNEKLFRTAIREFEEETGIILKNNCKYCELKTVDYNNKQVSCWATEFNDDIPPIIKSNLTSFGWPEVDTGRFFDIKTAKTKISSTQLEFLLRLEKLI